MLSAKQRKFTDAGPDCDLEIRDERLYCKKCEAFHKVSTLCPGFGSGHKMVDLPMSHVLYVAFYCKTCNNGKVIVDEDV